MTDVLNYILRGTEIVDPMMISTKKATDVLMSLIGGRQNAQGFVVSGFPRNMRDTGEYLESVGRVDGVMLLNWKEKTLERQITYGAQFGDVKLQTAKLELKNFKQFVMPVAEYFDYKGLLYLVNGERQPERVYEDFSSTFFKILSSNKKIRERQLKSAGSYREYKNTDRKSVMSGGPVSLPPVVHNPATPKPDQNRQHFIWIVGGPGSDKLGRVEAANESNNQRWRLIHTGSMLWELMSSEGVEDQEGLKETLLKGELVQQEMVLREIEKKIDKHPEVDGFFITGFPRNIQQAEAFQNRFGCSPRTVLVDCSELELGRNLGRRKGRMDDNLAASRRRLELYRELTLPLLKSLDEEDRLVVVDGDAEYNQVVHELSKALGEEMASATTYINKDDEESLNENPEDKTEDIILELEQKTNKELLDLEEEIIETYDQVEAILEAPNGHIRNGWALTKEQLTNGKLVNGGAGNDAAKITNG